MKLTALNQRSMGFVKKDRLVIVVGIEIVEEEDEEDEEGEEEEEEEN
jgi:hypothetical protein